MEAHLFWFNDEQWAKIEPWFPPEGKIGNEAGARGWQNPRDR